MALDRVLHGGQAPRSVAEVEASRRPNWVYGSHLSHQARQEALTMFVHRFTGDHKPAWANKPWKDGKPYPVQFASDLEWLANTKFAVTKDGCHDSRVKHCHTGTPTWPNNPELRA